LVPFQWAARQVANGVSVGREVRTPILATLLMAPVVWWLRDAVHPIVAILAGGAIYPVALWSLGGIDTRQVELFRQLLPRPRPS
jgi:Flp pilus assembly protein TadB